MCSHQDTWPFKFVTFRGLLILGPESLGLFGSLPLEGC